MSRRTKDIDLIGVAGPLAGLIVLLTMFSPQARQAITGLGIIVICLLGFVVLIAIAVVAYRHLDREPNPYAVERNMDWGKQLSAAVPDSQPLTNAELITQLRSIDWYQFEKIVALLYRKSGYAAISRGGANPDGGIDLIIKKDGQRIAVQCKQWRTWNVGVKAVREFLGALKDAGINQGIFITLKGYTGDAKSLADRHGIEILNETGLAKMLETTNASSDPETLAILQDEHKYCPKCESAMVLRTAKKGNQAGQRFWGCSNYPRCRFTLQT
jgi:hypothetical protein